MTKQQTALEAKEKEPVGVAAQAGNFFEHLKETTEKIAQRAFELFEKRGRSFGNDLEDWLRAESELVRRVPVEIKEIDGNLNIRAEIPGFRPEELKVYVEPRRLVISGKSEQDLQKEDKNTIYSEWRSQNIFRSVDLPREVKTENVEAQLTDGILSLSLQKTETVTPNEVRVKSA